MLIKKLKKKKKKKQTQKKNTKKPKLGNKLNSYPKTIEKRTLLETSFRKSGQKVELIDGSVAAPDGHFLVVEA